MNKVQWMTVAALACATTGQAFAQSPFYIGASIGSAKHAIDSGNINRQLNDLGFAGATTSSSNDETAYRITAGWQTVPYVALEVSYVDLGKPEFNSVATRPGTLSGKLKATGWTVDVVPQYQWTNGFGIFGRIGFARTETKTDFSASGAFRLAASSSKDTRNGWDAGLGLSYAITRNLTVRGEWTHFPDIGGDAAGGRYNVNMYTAGALWRF